MLFLTMFIKQAGQWLRSLAYNASLLSVKSKSGNYDDNLLYLYAFNFYTQYIDYLNPPTTICHL